MAVEQFNIGQQYIEPGFFFRLTNVGGIAQGIAQQGIVAYGFQAHQGALGQATTWQDYPSFEAIYGPVPIVEEGFQETPNTVVAFRVGETSAVTAIFTFDLTGGATVAVSAPVAWPGTGPNGWTATIRNSPDGTTRQMLLYDAAEDVLATVAFPIAPTTTGGQGEPGALVAAINASASPFLGTASLVGTVSDSATLANVLNAAPSTSGVDPTVASGDYATGLALLATQATFNAVVVDSNSQAVAAILQEFVDDQRSVGNFIVGFVGEPTTVARSTRLADCEAFDDYAVWYTINGWNDVNGAEQGYLAAGRMAAAYVATPITDGLVNYVIRGGGGGLAPNTLPILDPFTIPDERIAITAGAMLFGLNSTGQVVCKTGNNTFVTPDENYDAGWSSARRVKIRDYFLQTVAGTLEPYVGRLSNTPLGRKTVIAAIQRVIQSLVNMGVLVSNLTNPQSNTVWEDPANPPVGSSAWFVCQLDDTDNMNHMYLAIGTELSPA